MSTKIKSQTSKVKKHVKECIKNSCIWYVVLPYGSILDHLKFGKVVLKETGTQPVFKLTGM